MIKLTKKQRSLISTIMGALVAIAVAWQGVDWANFTFEFKNIAPLFLSAMIAIGGKFTSLNVKDDNK